MAKAYRFPDDAPAPPEFEAYFGQDGLGHDAYFKAVREWEQRLVEYVKGYYPNGGELQGFIYRWGVADGSASYMVARQRPLELWWLDDGDGYTLPEPHIRGLTVGEIRKMKHGNKALAEIFGRSA